MKMNVEINNHNLTVELLQNTSAQSLVNLLQDGRLW